MPYSVPAVGRPGHRRSFSHIVAPPSMSVATPTSTTTVTTGPFAPLVLPTRRRPSGRATFQVGSREDDDDDSPDESPEDNTHNDDDDRGHLPPLRLKTKFLSSFDNHPIPFPRSSPLPSPTHTESKKEQPLSPLTATVTAAAETGTAAARSPRPSVSRTSSTPVLLSNGKPLKSSLKSSNSSPNIPFPPQSLVPSIMFPQHHQRAASAPTTPHLIVSTAFSSASADTSPCASPSSSSTATSPVVPPQKNVHFASQEQGGLATVRLYNRSAKPASLLRIGDETETETEGESSSAPTGFFASIWNTGRASAYPFPTSSAAGPVPKLAAGTGAPQELIFEIDMKNSTPLPARGAERAEGNVYFESLGFLTDAGSDKPTQPLCLTGTLLVRNISYHKVVAVRYTLDDWHTTNDVLARHEKSLAALPERFLLASMPMIEEAGCDVSSTGVEKKREVVCRPRGFEDVVLENEGVPAWDRFRFELSLEKYQSTLEQRTMWFVGRYATGGPSPSSSGLVLQEQDWWDNNFGANYRIGFAKRVVQDRLKEEERKRKEGIYGGVNVNLNAYRRNVSHSAPPKFSPSRPHPAPPQISASQSFPPDATTQLKREQQAQAHQAALEQRLRRLHLMNYAAPGVAVPSVGRRSPLGLMDSKAEDEKEQEGKEEERSPLTLPVESSTTTSTDSTPLQTPTQEPEELGDLLQGTGPAHDADVNILMHDGDEGRWSLRRKVSEPAQDVTEAPSTKQDTKATSRVEETDKGRGASFEDPTPMHSTTDMVGLGFGVEMGTSPPFSLLAGLEGRLGSLAGIGSMPGMGRRQSSSQIHQSPAPCPTPGQSSSPGVNPLMPPQRRRHSHGQAQPVPTFGIGRTSSPTSSPLGTRSGSGSGSGSGSDSTSTTTARARWSVSSGMKTQQTQWKIHSPQPWPLPPQRRVTSPPPQVSSPLATKFLTEDEVLTRSPSPSLPLGQLLPGGSSLLQESLPPQSLPMEQPPLSPPDDALYQAFVRKWCFASGPGPIVSGPVGNGNVNGNAKGTEGGVTVRTG